ncbi:hypothetical protein FOL47_007425 [Perkinsus chesapeaki]|uniref:Uncharacterized protein n=1 Tax=Perkinsus chesapeaki TaxID=330153 RepID=A0A7J6MVS9_PERCH|nr:hypothetical protein FOL47_007425 [Perkinsus chesapeaki]
MGHHQRILLSVTAVTWLTEGTGVHVRFIPLGDILGNRGSSPLDPHASSPIPLDDINKLFPVHGSMAPGDGIMDSLLDSILNDLTPPGGGGGGFGPPGFGLNEPHFLKKLLVKNGPPLDDPCEKDVARLCPKDPSKGKDEITIGMQKSRLHCLGLRAQEVSQTCVKTVEKSLPFVCSLSISQYCSTDETMERGVLACLSEQLDKGKEMGALCKESIRATKVVIDMAKNSKGVTTVMKGGSQESALPRVRGSADTSMPQSTSPLSLLALLLIVVVLSLIGVAAWEEGLTVALGRFLAAPGATLSRAAVKVNASVGNLNVFAKRQARGTATAGGDWDGFEFDDGPKSDSYGAAAE